MPGGISVSSYCKIGLLMAEGGFGKTHLVYISTNGWKNSIVMPAGDGLDGIKVLKPSATYCY